MPHLWLHCLMSHELVCIMGTSAPIERVFSKAKLTQTDKRCNLDPDILNELILCSENLDFVRAIDDSNTTPSNSSSSSGSNSSSSSSSNSSSASSSNSSSSSSSNNVSSSKVVAALQSSANSSSSSSSSSSAVAAADPQAQPVKSKKRHRVSRNSGQGSASIKGS